LNYIGKRSNKKGERMSSSIIKKKERKNEGMHHLFSFSILLYFAGGTGESD